MLDTPCIPLWSFDESSVRAPVFNYAGFELHAGDERYTTFADVYLHQHLRATEMWERLRTLSSDNIEIWGKSG